MEATVVRCLLSVVCCPLSVVRFLSSVVCCLLSVVRCLLSVVCCQLSVVRCPLSVVLFFNPMNNINNFPSSFAVCYLANCPRKDTCLRFIAGEKLEKTKIFALCVLPYALQPNGTCQMYRDSTPIKGAYGFCTLLSNVKKKDLLPLREKIMAYLGNQTAYYSYRSGKRLLIQCCPVHYMMMAPVCTIVKAFL